MGPREVVEKLNESINRHDPVGGRELFADDVRIVTATARVITLAGLGRMLADSLAAFPDMSVRIERWVEQGDTVVTEEVMEGTHSGPFAGLAPTGRAVRLSICHITRVVDGRIVERITYHDSAGILRQLA